MKSSATPPRASAANTETFMATQNTNSERGGVVLERLVSPSAAKAAELEISANHLRALKECTAPIGVFVQKAIDEALENYRNATSRG